MAYLLKSSFAYQLTNLSTGLFTGWLAY